MIEKTIKTDTSKTTILIRLMAGAVFLSEGIQKFLYAAQRGAGRFEKIGFPNPEFFGNFMGVVEILPGPLILAGLLTHTGALVLRELSSYGFWSMTHEMRTDFGMGLGSLFLFIRGGGKWSLDLWLGKQLTNTELPG